MGKIWQMGSLYLSYISHSVHTLIFLLFEWKVFTETWETTDSIFVFNVHLQLLWHVLRYDPMEKARQNVPYRSLEHQRSVFHLDRFCKPVLPIRLRQQKSSFQASGATHNDLFCNFYVDQNLFLFENFRNFYKTGNHDKKCFLWLESFYMVLHFAPYNVFSNSRSPWSRKLPSNWRWGSKGDHEECSRDWKQPRRRVSRLRIRPNDRVHEKYIHNLEIFSRRFQL